MSIVFGISVGGILAVSIADVARGNNILQTTSVVPLTSLKQNIIQANFSCQVHLYNYGPEICSPTLEHSGFKGNWNYSSIINSNNTCITTMFCNECVMQGGSPSIKLEYQSPFSFASSVVYNFTAPYYNGDTPMFSMTDAVYPVNRSLVLRGDQASQFYLSLTTTEFATIHSFDYFVYNIFSKIFSTLKPQSYLGYSMVRNPSVTGGTVNDEKFWQVKPSVGVQITFLMNTNAYLVQQIGKATILDFFSKVFALFSAAFGLLALVLGVVEKYWKMYQQRKRDKTSTTPTPIVDTEMKMQNNE